MELTEKNYVARSNEEFFFVKKKLNNDQKKALSNQATGFTLMSCKIVFML